MVDEAKAWGDFWLNNRTGHTSGCLPERWLGIEAAQRAAWANFIGACPQNAKVLDLATGDGRVLGWLKDLRPDLKVRGIDLAPELPAPPAGVQTRGAVAMEHLPFDDSSFQVVVSQFGFEYSQVDQTAAEIARVLADGGIVGLMIHRGDGPILEHNRARREAIRWVLQDKQAITASIRALSDDRGGPDVATQVAAALARLGAHEHGQNSPAWEIPEAVRRAILIGKEQHAENSSIVATIEAIADQAENELGRIDSLERACARADAREDLAAAFAANDFKLRDTMVVRENSGRSIGDFLTIS